MRYLVTIGGTKTAYSAFLLNSAAKAANLKLSVVHVPKTIYNNLPLPEDCGTFGFQTARYHGTCFIRALHNDARSSKKWYIVVTLGRQAGHLPLAIAKASAASIALIPEDFKGEKPSLSDIVSVIEGSVYKRAVAGKSYGIAVVSDGLVDLLSDEERAAVFGDEDAYTKLQYKLAEELTKRCQHLDVSVVPRHLGPEMQGATPSTADILLSRCVRLPLVLLCFDFSVSLLDLFPASFFSAILYIVGAQRKQNTNKSM